MSLDHLSIDDITEDHLRSLIESGSPEGLTLEYKAEFWNRNDEGTKETLKDITAFANRNGGCIIVGVDEVDGVPTAICGIERGLIDENVQRIESLMRDGIEPRIVGYQIKHVAVANNRFVLIIRVPRSWSLPHRVKVRGTNRFFIRNSSGAHEAGVEELRAMFNSSRDIMERAVTFRDERLSKIERRLAPIPFRDRGRLIIHIVPYSIFQHDDPIDMNIAYENQQYFRPMTDPSSSVTATHNFYGLLIRRSGTECFGYTQIFRNGTIESTKSGLCDRYEGIPIVKEQRIREPLIKFPLNYIEGMKNIGATSPAILFVSLTGVGGSKLALPDGEDELNDTLPFPPEDPLCFPPVLIDSFNNRSDIVTKIAQLNDMLWNAAGREGCLL